VGSADAVRLEVRRQTASGAGPPHRNRITAFWEDGTSTSTVTCGNGPDVEQSPGTPDGLPTHYPRETIATTREVEEFAAYLRTLKDRGDRSYGALARRLNVGQSTLYRYCAGDAVPTEYATVERLARLCGAEPHELLELHRRWILADASRRRRQGRAGAAAEVEANLEVAAAVPPGVGATSKAQPVAAHGSPEEAVRRSAKQDRPRSVPALPLAQLRRTRWLVSAGAAAALLVTLGVVATVPHGRRGAHSPGRAAAGAATSPVRDSPASDLGPTTSPSAPSPPARSPSPVSSAGSRSRSSALTARREPAAPLAMTVRSHIWQGHCNHTYLIDKPRQQVPPPPAEADAEAWALSQGALHGGTTNVRITVQGTSATKVVLLGLRARVVSRQNPVQRAAYEMGDGCGGGLLPRLFRVNLDATRPVPRSEPGSDGERTIPAVGFPYGVSQTEPEVLLVTGQTLHCYCRWYLELEWASQGRTGIMLIDDHGRPFETSGVAGLPRYGWDPKGRQWVAY
jgi:plasmid maintenance system antidote protein VapI